MTTEKPIHQQAFPEPAVGAVVYNERGEILLARGPKFGDWWCLPGGHVEVGETAAAAVRREVKEELGITVDSVEFLNWADAVNPDFFHKQAHFIFFDFAARHAAGEVTVDQDEIAEYAWIEPAQALTTLKIDPFTTRAIEIFIQRGKAKDLLAECEEYKTGWQRALADYQNLKKETEARRQEWAVLSKQQILEEFIPVYDNFKKAYAHRPEVAPGGDKKFSQWADGVGLIQKQFESILKAHSVETIKTEGELFDPARHEAVGEEAHPGMPAGTIIREVDGGYTLGGRVIKVAKVIVAQ